MSREERARGVTGRGGAADETVLGLSLADRVVLLAGAPLAGLVIGFLVPVVSGWISRLPLPMLGLFKLIASFHTVWVVVVCVVIGLLLAAAVAVSAVTTSLTVAISDVEIRLTRDKTTHTVERSDVAAVFADGRTLVVLDRESRQVVRDKPEAKPAQLERAFTAHGYPWVGRDPYAELYRKWVPDTAELPSTVNALVAARKDALSKKVTKDADRLRREVEHLGYVLREERTSQYWRSLVRS